MLEAEHAEQRDEPQADAQDDREAEPDPRARGHGACFAVLECAVPDAPGNERRGDVRRPIELKVEYKRLNTFFADYTKNISRGGTFIKTARPLPIGTEFLFKLFIPGRADPLTIHGEVQRIVTGLDKDIDGDGTPDQGMAIKFVYRQGDPQAEIARTVEAIMSDSLGPRLYSRLMDHAKGKK
ncbi:MAG TPA: TIGR02266 family protein [Kofleriaceae bacterium]|nr:TIGR02266 family protein [Kofleriaceae bacterium]